MNRQAYLTALCAWLASVLPCPALGAQVAVAEPYLSEVPLPDGRLVTCTRRSLGDRSVEDPTAAWRTIVERHYEWTIAMSEPGGDSRVLMSYDVWTAFPDTDEKRTLTALAPSASRHEVIRVDLSLESDRRAVRVKTSRIPLDRPPLVGEAAAVAFARSAWTGGFLLTAPPSAPLAATRLAAATAGDTLVLSIEGQAGVIGELAVNASREVACLLTGSDLWIHWDPFMFRGSSSPNDIHPSRPPPAAPAVPPLPQAPAPK